MQPCLSPNYRPVSQGQGDTVDDDEGPSSVDPRDTSYYSEGSLAETIVPSEESSESRPNEHYQMKCNHAKGSDQRHPLRFWHWEVLALLFAMAAAATIIVVPAYYHGATEQQWPFSINLNTVIALLATTMRATMLVAVAEVLGQMKWRYFDQPRPLSNLQHFDHASRGVLGSIKLIWIARSSFLSIAAAIITILSMAVGPFTQQAVSTVSCSVPLPLTTASLPISHYFPGDLTLFVSEIHSDIKAAMIHGLINPTSTDNRVQAICETGNCTFPSFSSNITHATIGACSTCFDTTNFITRMQFNDSSTLNNSAVNYTLPNTQSVCLERNIHFAVNASNLEWAKMAFPAGFAAKASGAFANATFLSFTQGPCNRDKNGTMICPHQIKEVGSYRTEDEMNVLAVSCILYPCLRSFHGKITGATLDEQIISTQPATPNLVTNSSTSFNDFLDSFGPKAEAYYKDYASIGLPCVLDGVAYDLDALSQVPDADMATINVNGTPYTVPEKCLYKISGPYIRRFGGFISDDFFNGYCSTSEKVPYCEPAWWLAPLYRNYTASFNSISMAINQIANAITTQFRTTGTSNQTFMVDSRGYRENVIGTVLGTTVCPTFNWRWMLLPVILVLATAMILLFAIVQSWTDSTVPVWKTSILPLVFFGVSSDGGRMSTLDLDGLHEHGEKIKARFRTGSNAGFKESPKD